MSENSSDNVDSIDPRVQIELERLNSATDDINKLEVDLDEARANFRSLLCESTSKIDALSKRLGSCIEKARPYYEARFKASEALRAAQEAAVKYEKANSAHSAAREMVYLAEQGLGGKCTLDPAWQEMLNHATSRVNEAEVARAQAGSEHLEAGRRLTEVSTAAQRLQRELRRSIARSSASARRNLLLINIIAYQHELLFLPYFEMKALFNQQLELQKIKVQSLEKQVNNAKLTYAEALRNLEQISDEIHRSRRRNAHKNETPSKDRSQFKSVSKYPEPIASFPDYPYSDTQQQTTVFFNQTYIPDKNNGFNNLNSPSMLSSSKDYEASKPSFGTNNQSSNRKLSPYGNSYDNYKEPSVENSQQSENKLTLKNNSYNNSFKDYSPDEFKTLPSNISPKSSPIKTKYPPEQVSGYRNISADKYYAGTNPFYGQQKNSDTSNNDFVTISTKNCNTQKNEPVVNIPKSHTAEWTEINLDSSSPEELNSDSKNNDNIPYQRLDTLSPLPQDNSATDTKSPLKKKLTKQMTLPCSSADGEFQKAVSSKASRIKLDTNISNWISRSSAKTEEANLNASRRQSLDNILGPTGEKVKEIFSQGIMMLNITSLTERRNSEPRASSAPAGGKKIPSPLDKTLGYLTADDDLSDSDSLASVDMLTEEQIQSLMLERDIDAMCEQLLGTPMTEVCSGIKPQQQTAIGDDKPQIVANSN